MEDLVIRQSRPKTILALIGALAFVGIGVALVSHPHAFRRSAEYILIIGWLCIALFGAFAVAGLRLLLRPVELRIKDDGFEIGGPKPRSLVPWVDVERFYVTKVHSTKFVSYVLRPDAKARHKRVGAGAGFGDADGVIPSNLEQRPSDICVTLEARRSTAGSPA